jgi:hypothetical protein
MARPTPNRTLEIEMTTTTHIYYWRTDAASGRVDAASEEAALAALTEQGEWFEGAERDGSWIAISSSDVQGAADELLIGQRP